MKNGLSKLAPGVGMAVIAILAWACGGREEEPEASAAAPSATAVSEPNVELPPIAAFGAIDGQQWPSWRGPENTGASRAKLPVAAWESPEHPIVLWKAPLGGRSTPIVLNGRVYIVHVAGEGPTWQEEVVCLDADDGSILWRHAFPLFHTDVPTDRVGWASPAGDPETGNVYVHGVQGLFFCYDRDGNVLWEKSLTEQFGRISGYGGRTTTPFIDRDLVILTFLNSGLGDQARGMHRALAMDKRTGEIIWWSAIGETPEDTTFTVPSVAVIDGLRQLISGTADGWIVGVKIATGERIWSFHASERAFNASVVVAGNRVYAAHSEENVDNTVMGRVVCVDATGEGDVTATHEVWRRDGFRDGYATPALAEGKLYAVDNSCNLICLDAATGEEYWTLNVGKVGWGSPVWADGKLYMPEVDGRFHIIDVSGDEPKILSTIEFQREDGAVEDLRGCPAVAYGRLYVLTRYNLFCLGERDRRPEPIEIAALPPDGPADPTPAHLQLVPAEAQIHLDATVTFQPRLYDARGRFIRVADQPAWTAEGLQGSLLNNIYTPSPEPNGQFGVVTARVGELTATARVRVYPALPILEDFESILEGGTPASWVGATRVKFQTVIEDGNHLLKKDAQNVQFRRALVYLGAPEARGYTIQADVRAGLLRRNLPDMGIINSRYEFNVLGNAEELRLIAWVPMPRVVRRIPFTIEPDVWYTMKCDVEYAGERALVRGKIWPRAQPEPEAWTIELEDPLPNRNGSPGLSCFSLAEVYYDNVKVTPN